MLTSGTCVIEDIWLQSPCFQHLVPLCAPVLPSSSNVQERWHLSNRTSVCRTLPARPRRPLARRLPSRRPPRRPRPRLRRSRPRPEPQQAQKSRAGAMPQPGTSHCGCLSLGRRRRRSRHRPQGRRRQDQNQRLLPDLRCGGPWHHRPRWRRLRSCRSSAPPRHRRRATSLRGRRSHLRRALRRSRWAPDRKHRSRRGRHLRRASRRRRHRPRQRAARHLRRRRRRAHQRRRPSYRRRGDRFQSALIPTHLRERSARRPHHPSGCPECSPLGG
jgi:hypothetical protein